MKITKRLFIGITAGLLMIQYLTFNFLLVYGQDGILTTHSIEFLRLMFWVTISLLVSGIILLFTSNEIFKKWLKNILTWALPLIIIVIAAGDDGGQILQIPRPFLAFVTGVALVLLTITFIVIQTLRPKLRKNKK